MWVSMTVCRNTKVIRSLFLYMYTRRAHSSLRDDLVKCTLCFVKPYRFTNRIGSVRDTTTLRSSPCPDRSRHSATFSMLQYEGGSPGQIQDLSKAGGRGGGGGGASFTIFIMGQGFALFRSKPSLKQLLPPIYPPSRLYLKRLCQHIGI